MPHTAKIADRHEATKRRKIKNLGGGVHVGHFIVCNITNKTSVCFIRLGKQHKHAKNLLKKIKKKLAKVLANFFKPISQHPVKMPFQTFVPENQWPPTPDLRQRLAMHLVHEIIPAISIEDLLGMFSTGLCLSNVNGILTTNNNIMFPVTLASNDDDALPAKQTVYANQLVGLGFHAVFIAFANDIKQVPCMLYQRTLYKTQSESTMLYFKSLYTQVMPIISVPPTIASALQIARPDIHILIMTIYMAWLKRVQRPELVDEALAFLIKSVWEFDSISKPFLNLQNWINDYSIQMAVINSKFDKKNNFKNIVVSKLTVASFCVDGYSLLVASKRDRILLALLFLFHAESGWAVHGLPQNAPNVFKKLERLQPYLFDPTKDTPLCLFNELTYLGSDSKML